MEPLGSCRALGSSWMGTCYSFYLCVEALSSLRAGLKGIALETLPLHPSPASSSQHLVTCLVALSLVRSHLSYTLIALSPSLGCKLHQGSGLFLFTSVFLVLSTVK